MDVERRRIGLGQGGEVEVPEEADVGIDQAVACLRQPARGLDLDELLDVPAADRLAERREPVAEPAPTQERDRPDPPGQELRLRQDQPVGTGKVRKQRHVPVVDEDVMAAARRRVPIDALEQQGASFQIAPVAEGDQAHRLGSVLLGPALLRGCEGTISGLGLHAHLLRSAALHRGDPAPGRVKASVIGPRLSCDVAITVPCSATKDRRG